MFDALATAVGTVVLIGLGFGLGCLAWVIVGNVFGGIRGAYRLRRLRMKQAGKPPFGHWDALKFGIYCWYGRRYRNGVGEYWQFGGMIVPMDGRDKIQRDEFHGA